MIKWRVYRTTKNIDRAVRNLMDIYNWKLAVKFIEKKSLKEDYRDSEANWKRWYSEKLDNMESTEVFTIDRRR